MRVNKCTSPVALSGVKDLLTTILFVWQEGYKTEKQFALGNAWLSVPVSCKMYSSHS